jgi:hypothetical protein
VKRRERMTEASAQSTAAVHESEEVSSYEKAPR